ncbi:similar to S. cerevisiae YER088C DOT6 Protein involved in rRNA and ribosome biogenesis [Maudiozyma saulgeensis]|uniref:Similar to S. cerevisiae YER088C DOT6 Protein involved in rRNA and ribosome biogenesis n=1 Tax=Maudiozyma saulgeensis TaxID=1789683 RepID=A0A1X7R556_9SACH|nr:similar to S. cerevisiae YER088C DOT6 Protein involved in rRNA and ribosome biogenesis [Kazachstania saulgeensis]
MPSSKSTFSTMTSHSTSSILNNHPHPQLHNHALNNNITNFHSTIIKKKDIINNEPNLLSRSNTISSPSPSSATSPSTAVSSSMSSPTTNPSTIKEIIINSNEINNNNQINNGGTKSSSNTATKIEEVKLVNYSNTIAPNSAGKNPSSWDPQDDLLLRHLKEIKKLGWKDISQFFNNRTPNACQFRWRRLKSGNLKSNKTALVDVTDYTAVIKALNEGKLNEYKLMEVPETVNHEPKQRQININESNDNDMISPKKKNEEIKFSTLTNKDNNYQQIVTTKNVSPSKEVYASKFISSSNLSFSPNDNIVNTQDKNQNIGNNNFGNDSLAKQFKPQGQGKLHPIEQLKTHSNIPSSHSTTNSKKFIKPRSFSHSVTRPKLPANMRSSVTSFNNGVFNGGPSASNEEENVGFIPKIIVRSRRSSLAVPVLQQSQIANQPQSHQNSNLLSPSASYSNIANALNTTLVTSKSRKNSISHMSRRSSFNVTSGTSSRKQSIISAAVSNSISNQFPLATHTNGDVHLNVQSMKQRKDSAHRKDFHGIGAITSKPEHSFPSTYGFVDTPSSNVRHESSATGGNIHYASKDGSPSPCEWTSQEDAILLECYGRNLSCKEMSILLNNKSENETQWRLDYLKAQGTENKGQSPENENVDPLHIGNVSNQYTGMQVDNKDEVKQHSNTHLPSINNILNNTN